jgi:protein-S-isoprenylcysteine O-methyltransferase Ste14
MKVRTAALGATVLGTVFALGPWAMIRLNENWGWPVWRSDIGQVIGGVLIVAGIAVAAYASRLFARIGRGTPVPTEPPTQLVLSGLYRYSRNPMYVADVAILFGLFLHRGEVALLLYAVLVLGFIQAWVVWHEEPVLRRRFGEAYVRYTKAVPRWLYRRGPTNAEC